MVLPGSIVFFGVIHMFYINRNEKLDFLFQDLKNFKCRYLVNIKHEILFIFYKCHIYILKLKLIKNIRSWYQFKVPQTSGPRQGTHCIILP